MVNLKKNMTNLKEMKLILNQILVSKKLIHCLLVVVIPALIFYSLSIIRLRSVGFEIMEILRDPAQQSGESSFRGFLSNIGIWLWVCSAAISYFFVLTSETIIKKNFKGLFILTGTLSMLLAVDDFFMIHDRYVSQKICYLVYAIFIGFLFIRHFKMIIEIAGFAFLLAGVLLASSIITDLIQSKIPLDYQYTQIIEEGFKFIGAATWLYFIGRVASSLLIPIKER